MTNNLKLELDRPTSWIGCNICCITMKKMKKAFSLACLQPQHQKMSNQSLYGIRTIQNEIYCSSSSEDYTVVSSEQSESYHQRCSSKSSGTSSVDTYTLKVRMENLEIALTMLKDNFQRMEDAMNKQIEKAIDIITAEENEPDVCSETKDKYFMKRENNKLVKAVRFLTESSKIMRNALSEHSKAISHLAEVIDQPLESHHTPNLGRNESPVERKKNKCKNQRDKIQILYPKAINPLEISEYLAIENPARLLAVQPPCCICKTNNVPSSWKNTFWDQTKSASCINTNIERDEETFVRCNCRLCSLDKNVDPDGEYVTLLHDYIGEYNAAYQWYNKPSVSDVRTYSDANKLDNDHFIFDERKGTLV